jgi:hypothetical protein
MKQVDPHRRRKVWFKWYNSLSQVEIKRHYRSGYRESTPVRAYSKELQKYIDADNKKGKKNGKR